MKLWDKGYVMNREAEEYTVGDDYLLDKALIKYDCRASIAHAEMLGRIGVLTKREVRLLTGALRDIIKLDGKHRFTISKEQEDSHTAIENYLVNRLGAVGKKIHTARSRNDQVLGALRLYCMVEIGSTTSLIGSLQDSIRSFGRRYGKVKFPGYTHTRKAMPSSISMWSGAFYDALEDDLKLLEVALALVDQSPLGTGAGYGVPLAVDREYVAKRLGFSRVQKNPIYTQESRGKFESTIIHSLSQVMFDLNKMAEDIIVFSMPEFGYFAIPKEFSTGSSMMPQKSNPDVLELVRANYHVVNSYESRVKGIIGNLPSGYNRDLQLTKGPVIKSFCISKMSISVMSALMGRLRVDRERCAAAMTEELYATESAYGMVRLGIPFRDAYKRVAKKYSKR
jgi:argininosuccinate lyase